MQLKSTSFGISLLSMISMQLVGMDDPLIQHQTSSKFFSQSSFPVIRTDTLQIMFVQPTNENNQTDNVLSHINLKCKIEEQEKTVLIENIKYSNDNLTTEQKHVLEKDILQLLHKNQHSLYSCINEVTIAKNRIPDSLALAFVAYVEDSPKKFCLGMGYRIRLSFHKYVEQSEELNQPQEEPVPTALKPSKETFSLAFLWSYITTMGHYIPHTLCAFIIFTAGIYVGKKY